MARYLILLGPPGVGKGTQARRLASALGIPHVSSGDLFRANVDGATELGRVAKDYLDRGLLVPDDVTIGMIDERLARPDCAGGALLDGFPRTVAQAQALDDLLARRGAAIDLVADLRARPEVLVPRLSGRRTCKASGHIYHEAYNPPARPGVCDVDGSPLIQRDDDRPETVERRIRVYLEQTAPLEALYRARRLLFEVDGEQPVEAVTDSLLREIRRRTAA